ncbi:MAG TPA: hypothetical protein VGO68_03375 [Pyrinomonadaceae bacterium]|jgi:hypothetical protein|nr:hypothetical protein [Pyrinomonadaceae bacterium]
MTEVPIGGAVATESVDTSKLLNTLATEIAAAIVQVQSPYLYIQAAGSDGSDGSAPGIHLRWDLLGSLGEKHLPKGNLAAGPDARYPAFYGFNKADDFVTVLRVPYDHHYPCTVNFSSDQMVAAVETGPQRQWKFAAVVENVLPPQHREVVIRFADVAQYDTIRAAVDPLTASSQFLARYTGVVEAEVTNQLCFALTFTASVVERRRDSTVRVEAVSVSENLAGAELFISCRRRFAPAALPPPSNPAPSVRAENAKYFRFDYTGCTPVSLQLETYEQFIIGSIVNRAAWETIGTEFSLTDEDSTVYDRLEDNTLANVNGKWPRYLGADPVSGLFTTSVPNYRAKWDPTLPPTSELTDANGLRKGVVDYLTLSMNAANATGLASLPAQDPHDQGGFEISYLQMLKLVALDFPVARMLGLGCIDAGIAKTGGVGTKYVYVAVYRTTAPLEETSPPAIVLPVTETLNPGETALFPVGLSVPAGANGTFVTLTSSAPAIVTVSPASVFIPAGKMTSTLPTLTSSGIGSTIITASAPGFASASTQVHVGRVPAIGIPATMTLKLGEEAPFPVTLSEAAPASGNPPGSTVPRTLVYMTLPTSLLDYRLPPAPVQDDPTFGIRFDNGTGAATELTDADGYTPLDDSRIINLHVKPYDTVQEFGPFFVPATEFCSSDVTKPVFYGCKYKLASEANYRVPELSNDPEYLDPSGVAEVAPLLPQVAVATNAANPPIYTHDEKENGLHEYALYGVNWYSRPSTLSNSKDVNTLIPKRSTLLPPANLAVQLIQPEDPLILTTASEQQRLASLSGDTTLVRCTFNWNQNHYIPQKLSVANVYANKVQFCFRQQPPRAVNGELRSVTSISNKLLEVRTQSYVLTSISPPQTVTPTVVPGDEQRFVGSSFAANQVLYVVDGVAQSTVPDEGAVFQIRKQTQSTVEDLNNNNQHSPSVQVAVPSTGDRFLVVENMNDLGNWGANQPLAKEVKLINFLESGQLHTETVAYPDGSQATFNIGGIQETATITELEDVDPTSQTIPPALIPGSKTGIFTISFLSYQLAPHPDVDVEWYKGTARVHEAAGDDIKVLEVWKIDVSGPTLELTVFDPTFKVDSSYAPLPGYSPIQSGAGVPVNFHPGYRVYLLAQIGVLDQTTIFPALAQSTKQTFLATRSRNTTLATESNLTTPVVIQARKITTTEPPDEPVGPLYATRPNFDGKATWTMDVKVALNSTREPYALVFYRANERAVLDTLYKGHPADGTEPAADTADGIEAALKMLPAADAAFAANRWRDLVNVQNLHADHGFHEYTPGGFRFPIPNNATYVIPGTTIAPFDGVNRPGDPAVTFTIDDQSVTMLDVVKRAIEGFFLPLTESPVIYQFLKTATQTSSKKPVIRNLNGDLLQFTSAAFDPSPMAVKYVSPGGDTQVRFTDYTLDGAAKNIYFYYAVEMSDQMKLSRRSPIAGPVTLVNAYPAEAPVIRKVTSIIKDSVLQIPTGVKLLVNAYLAAEGITKFKLYRATNANDATATRTMKLVRDYDAALGSETEIFDDFSDLDFLPFGDPIFYRVVAMREIINERNTTEFIPSQPSSLARASILDVDNPLAPSLVFNSDPPTMSQPVQLTNVVLSWPKVTHNATYYLYKQNGSGNWNKIYQEKTDADPVIVPLSATDLETGVLLKQDAVGLPIYHRFKVEVESTSGMFNLNENVLSVPATCIEGYSFVDVVLNYADDFQAASPLSDRLCDPAVSTFPGTMTFQDIITSLPTAHVFDRIEITVADGLGHAAKKTINTAGVSVTFQHGEGTGLVLDGSVINVDYAIRVRAFTDSCQGGLLFSYKLRFGPQIALMGITSLLSYTDSATTISPLESFVASGIQFPTTMSFTDIVVLPVSHTFASIQIQVQDDQGSSFSKSIEAAGGTVTFNQGDGGLALDASAPNRTYLVSARLFTDLSPDGVLFQYTISYG